MQRKFSRAEPDTTSATDTNRGLMPAAKINNAAERLFTAGRRTRRFPTAAARGRHSVTIGRGAIGGRRITPPGDRDTVSGSGISASFWPWPPCSCCSQAWWCTC